jgi:hypothetical protein
MTISLPTFQTVQPVEEGNRRDRKRLRAITEPVNGSIGNSVVLTIQALLDTEDVL